MLKLSSRAALILLSSTLVLTNVACSKQKQTLSSDNKALPNTTAISTPNAASETVTASPAESLESKQVESVLNQPSHFELALDKASAAFSISQSAQSSTDWHIVANEWQEAIALMKSVPKNSPAEAIAQSKIAQYQSNLNYAKQRANHTTQSNDSVVAEIPETLSPPPGVPPTTAQEASLTESQNQTVFQARIKRRFSGIPVIDVTFNGTQHIEMIVDTGASGTVLTQKDARLLGVVPVAKAKASTASAKSVEFPVGYVDSIQVGGAVIMNVPVVLSGPELEIGLLGHDFFSNYDITIKRDVVEFRPH